MQKKIVYEQPLNERIRFFLRLEHLFGIVTHTLNGPSEWDSRAALAGLIDIADLLSRSDVKTELIKELERNAATLTRLDQNPGVDDERLQAVLGKVNALLQTLRQNSCYPGQQLRQDELTIAIKQRSAIPGGTCNFDIPAYYHWLHKPVQERVADLNGWLSDLTVVHQGIDLALQMIRNSATPTRETAINGFFQAPIDPNVTCQMIRVVLPSISECFPEVSGGKHRFSVRFLEQPTTASRPVQTDKAVEFELHCCIL
ncbi:MAG: cell division protein ZapD [Gammaproteobacteria bacterium]|nr:cell division protein ZapD [Gammaproteobacteria bacterium]MCI0591770.1 cell division protein ZapD [Gammaproteobacteria bacterium]